MSNEQHSAVDGSVSGQSVVLDRNVTVRVSKRPQLLAVAAVVAFAAFTVIWFAARGDDGYANYKAGPVARSFVEAQREAGASVDLSGEELACIDRVGARIDPADLAEGFNFTDAATKDDVREFGGKVYDDCLSRETRVSLFAGSMNYLGRPVTGDAAICAATKLDDAILEAGGYRQLASGDMDVRLGFVQVMFGAFAECVGPAGG